MEQQCCPSLLAASANRHRLDFLIVEVDQFWQLMEHRCVVGCKRFELGHMKDGMYLGIVRKLEFVFSSTDLGQHSVRSKVFEGQFWKRSVDN